MDAGVYKLSVFPDNTGPQSRRLLSDGERIRPDLNCTEGKSTDAAVSLIIPTFFNRPLKQQSLRHLLSGIEGSRCIREVVLVSSGSNDVADLDLLPAPAELPIQIVTCEMNRRARSRNVGAAAAKYDLLMFLDDDMLVHDWSMVDAVVTEMLTRNLDCALFPRRHYLRFPWLYDEREANARIAEWRKDPEAEHDKRYILDPVHHGFTQPLLTFCFPGCFMLIQRQAYHRIGGFPEEFEGWGLEDTQFAMQAITHLNVLNLFLRTSALLHIDHPVSPYKSQEYDENLRKFNRKFRAWDVARFTELVLTGADSLKPSIAGPALEEEMLPLISAGRFLPFEFPSEPVRRNYMHMIEARLDRGFDPLPAWVVLHGSRSTETARDDSDYDLLVLFQRGISTDFFVTKTSNGQIVEIEYSDCARFEQLASGPAYAPVQCPMELSKLTKARVLYGDEARFNSWARELTTRAVIHGRAVWFLYLLAMELNSEKHGIGRQRLVKALIEVFTFLDSSGYASEINVLRSGDSHELRRHLLDVLDQDVREWRIDLSAHKKVFAFQPPEIWTALTSLASR